METSRQDLYIKKYNSLSASKQVPVLYEALNHANGVRSRIDNIIIAMDTLGIKPCMNRSALSEEIDFNCPYVNRDHKPTIISPEHEENTPLQYSSDLKLGQIVRINLNNEIYYAEVIGTRNLSIMPHRPLVIVRVRVNREWLICKFSRPLVTPVILGSKLHLQRLRYRYFPHTGLATPHSEQYKIHL